MMTGKAVRLLKQMRKAFSKLPESVFVEGKDYAINTDFRVWAELLCFMESDAPYEEKILKLLCDGYTCELPPHLDTAIFALFDFMMLGKMGRGSRADADEKIMDFYEDEGLIYAAFLQQYAIDLYTVDLHWWSFMNLLKSLDENTAIMKVISYRSVKCESIKNKELKKFYRKMKNRYRLLGNEDDRNIAMALESVM